MCSSLAIFVVSKSRMRGCLAKFDMCNFFSVLYYGFCVAFFGILLWWCLLVCEDIHH